jgi:hypothetical protein
MIKNVLEFAGNTKVLVVYIAATRLLLYIDVKQMPLVP